MKITVRGNPHTYERSKKCGVGEKKRGREVSMRKKLLPSVKILQDATEQPGALNDAGFEESPFIRRNQEWNHVDFPGPVCSERIAVNVIGDAVLANSAFSALPAPFQFLGADCPE
jgi:hypothetical protein